MSQPKLQYTSLLRGPILLAHFFATAFAIGYSVAGVRMSIFRIFAHGASPHRTCDAIMLGFMWYGGFTALAASGLTVVLVIVRCCLMSTWARAAAAGPGGAGVPRLKSIRSRHASARPAALVSLWLAPLAMLESLEELRNGDGNDTSSATAPGAAAGGAAAPQDRYRCSSPGDDVECAAALLLRRSPTVSGNASDENSSDLKSAAAGTASIAAGGGGCYSVGYVPLPGAPPQPHLTPPPAASAFSTAASSTSPAPAAAATAAAVPPTPPTAPSSNAFLPPTPSATPPAPAAAPQPPPTTSSSHHHHQHQQLLGTPGRGPPSSSSTSSSTCRSTLSSRPSRCWGATWRLLRCFAAEAGMVLAPVWLHLFVVGSALGVLALLGARVMTDPFY